MPENALTDAGRYAAAAETLRSTAKWLLAAFAGVGGVLVAGIQLTNLGELGSDNLWQLAVALVALGGAVVAVGYMIKETAKILTVEWVTLAHFDDETVDAMLRKDRSAQLDKEQLDVISDRIEDVREELYAYAAPSVPELHRYLREANETAAKVASGELQVSADDQAKAFARARELRAAAKEVADYANYERTRRLFHQLKRRLARGAVCVVISVTIFAYATHPTTEDKARSSRQLGDTRLTARRSLPAASVQPAHAEPLSPDDRFPLPGGHVQKDAGVAVERGNRETLTNEGRVIVRNGHDVDVDVKDNSLVEGR